MKYYSQIPRTIADLVVLGGEMEQGLVTYGTTLDLKQVDAPQMKAATDALVLADRNFNAARSAQETAYANFHAADSALTGWLGKVTGALSAFFGKRWNRQWAQVGFTTPSIAIPATINDRLALALRMIDCLTSTPGYEAPTLGVTAAAGAALRNAAVSRHALAAAADTALEEKGVARGSAVEALTSLMRLLVGVLGQLLKADDPRWLAFGLEMPANRTTPGQPAGLEVAARAATGATAVEGSANTHQVLLSCEATPFASRYRFRMRIIGVQSEYKLVASTKEPLAQVEVPNEAAVEFIVQAVNGSRQGVASAPVVYAATANKALAPAGAPANMAAASLTMPGSHGNGQANGSRLPALV